MGGLEGTMTKGRGASKRLGMGYLHVRNASGAKRRGIRAQFQMDRFNAGFALQKLTIKAPRESDSVLFRN
jgi:hypothetical protein